MQQTKRHKPQTNSMTKKRTPTVPKLDYTSLKLDNFFF